MLRPTPKRYPQPNNLPTKEDVGCKPPINAQRSAAGVVPVPAHSGTGGTPVLRLRGLGAGQSAGGHHAGRSISGAVVKIPTQMLRPHTRSSVGAKHERDDLNLWGAFPLRGSAPYW